ncbi:hypothetical protein ACEQ8H_007207 [Pleosporales sp. CAS-2024a]
MNLLAPLSTRDNVVAQRANDQETARAATLEIVNDITKMLSMVLPWSGARVQPSLSAQSHTLVDFNVCDETDDFSDLSSQSTFADTGLLDADLTELPVPTEEALDQELLRLSQENSETANTQCTFCKTDFDGPKHRQDCINHVLQTHQIRLDAPIVLKQQDPQNQAFSKHENKGIKHFTKPVKIGDLSNIPSLRYIKDLEYELFAIGAWYPAEQPLTAAVVLTNNPRSEQRPDAKTLTDTIMSLASKTASEADGERINDFFNGLDIVIEDLSRRLQNDPRGKTVCAIQATLAALGRPNSSDAITRSTSVTTLPTDGSSGVKNCSTTLHVGSSAQSEMNTGLFDGVQKWSSRDESEAHTGSPSGSSEEPSPVVSIAPTPKKLKSLHIACPYRKHDEVHGRHQLQWHADHMTELCMQNLGRNSKQIRGKGVVRQWQELYIRMFDQSLRIPYPNKYASLLLDEFANPKLVDANNHEWIPKNVWLRRQGTESNLTTEYFGFDFNDSTRTQTTQPSNDLPKAAFERWMTNGPLQAQRIARVVDLNPAESDALGDEMLETISRLAEHIRNQAIPGHQNNGSLMPNSSLHSELSDIRAPILFSAPREEYTSIPMVLAGDPTHAFHTFSQTARSASTYPTI